MVRVSSADVLQMQDERFTDLLKELNEKQRSWSSAWLFGSLGLVAVALLSATLGGFMLALGLLMGIGLGLWRDSYSRSAVLFYELDDQAKAAYEALTSAFDQLLACQGKWHVDSGGAVRDLHAWKRNAGASHLIDRRPTVFSYALPNVLKCNITPPAIKVGKETLLLFPDVMLVVEKEKVGAVAYDALTIRYEDNAFIEDGSLPADATIIRQTWKHPNKSGGPDRRFRDNRMLPVCLYESIYLTSPNGLNELVQVSRNGMARHLADTVRQLTRATGSKSEEMALPQL